MWLHHHRKWKKKKVNFIFLLWHDNFRPELIWDLGFECSEWHSIKAKDPLFYFFMNMFISPIICELMIMSKYGSKLVFHTLRKLIRSITDGFPHHFTLLHSWWVSIWHRFWGSIAIFAFLMNLIFWKFEADWSWEYKDMRGRLF